MQIIIVVVVNFMVRNSKATRYQSFATLIAVILVFSSLLFGNTSHATSTLNTFCPNGYTIILNNTKYQLYCIEMQEYNCTGVYIQSLNSCEMPLNISAETLNL